MGRPKLTEREPHDSDTLTQIALLLFTEKGYDATSMADIAAAAGISKSSIYFHVQGKEELLARAVSRALDAFFAVLDEPEAKQGPAVDRLRHVVQRGIQIDVQYLPDVTVLRRLRGNTEVERAAMERRRTFDANLAKLVRRAQLEGGVRKDIEPIVLTRLLLGLVTSFIEWYNPDGKLTWRDIADAVLAIAFDGITIPCEHDPDFGTSVDIRTPFVASKHDIG